MTVLVLDLDGVVVLGHPEGGRWDKNIARDLGMKPEHLQTCFFQRRWRAIEIGEADLLETLARVWPELECAGEPRAFVDYWFANDSRLDTDVLAQVDAWRAAGRKAYIATVQEHHRARYIWEVLGFAARFDGMLYSAALGVRKPDAAFFERVLAKLPVTLPGEILFLDDRIGNVEAARAAGWRAFQHSGPDDLRRAIAAL